MALSFKIDSVKCDEFAIIDKSLSSGIDYTLNTNIEVKIMPEQHFVGVFTEFEFYKDKHNLLKLAVSCHFRIELENWNAHIQGIEFVLLREEVIHVAAITVGAARGVLAVKTEYTPYASLVLPPVNLQEMINSEARIPLITE